MSQVQDQFTVCDQCGGAIPSAATRLASVSFEQVTPGGSSTEMSGKDFCCSAHAVLYVEANTSVVTPNPLYDPPPSP